VQKMKVGGKARLVCPPKAGYGDRGELRAGITPGSVLDFDVELLEVKPPPPPPVPTPGSTPGFTPPQPGK
jgi:FKBP-type peptidyl-prolyl cis-trans isomerase FkpA